MKKYVNGQYIDLTVDEKEVVAEREGVRVLPVHTRDGHQTGRDCSRCAFRYAVGSVCATSLNACVNLPCVA